MMNRETHESGSFNITALALLAIAICAVAVMLMPAHANTESPAAAYSASTDYLPAQIANQAVEVEPMPEMYY
jgi:hypothetical protein